MKDFVCVSVGRLDESHILIGRSVMWLSDAECLIIPSNISRKLKCLVLRAILNLALVQKTKKIGGYSMSSGTQQRQRQFEELVRPHLDGLYRLAFRFTRKREDAEDLVQDLAIKVYGRLDELATLNNPRTWLSKVLYRQYLDKVRSQRRSHIRLVSDLSEGEALIAERVTSPTPEPSVYISQLDTVARLEAALSELGEEHRVLVLMHDVEGYDLNEIKEVVDLPIGTIKSRLHRARAKLRHILGGDETGSSAQTCDSLEVPNEL